MQWCENCQNNVKPVLEDDSFHKCPICGNRLQLKLAEELEDENYGYE